MKKNKFWANKKVLVVGAKGFVGSRLTSALQERPCEVRTLSRSRNSVKINKNTLNKLMSGTDVVINCAAIDGNSQFKKDNSALICNNNVAIVSEILDSAHMLGVKKVVLLSSADIYSNTAKSPFTENDDFRKFPEYTESGYVLSKIFAEQLADQYSKTFGTNILIARPTNIYGVGDKNDRIIPSILSHVKNNSVIPVWGDGSQKRNFIYITDFIAILLALIEKDVQGPVNIGSPETATILDIVSIASKIYKQKPLVSFDLKKQQPNRVLSIRKLKKITDFSFTKLRQGMIEISNNEN